MLSGWIADGFSFAIRALTGARALWRCPPLGDRRVYYGNHVSHGDFVMIWSALPRALRDETRPVAGAELPDVVDLRTPERAASEAELFRQLDAALDALPFEQRSAFVLAQLQGLSYEDVGRIEGVGVGTVKSRIARAREKLRCLLSHAAEPHS